MIKVNEIFKSIQGEGTMQGELMIFIRLTGCNLRCKWCDTKYAYDKGIDMTTEKIIDKVEKLECKNVLITGGEPLIQDINSLVHALCGKNHHVFVETNGTIDIRKKDFSYLVEWIIDYKLPSSGMSRGFNFGNLNIRPFELKFVIANKKDYKSAKRMAVKMNSYYKLTAFKTIFSPCIGEIEPKELAEWMIKDNLPYRYSLQIQKFIWDKNKRGV